MIDKNEISHVCNRMLNTYFGVVLLTCSASCSFLTRILIIMDGDVESKPGPNNIDLSIEGQDIQRVKGRPRSLALKEDL